jgi:hypothetical protein
MRERTSTKPRACNCSLAHHGAAHAEDLGQLLFAQAFAGAQLALDDGAHDALGDQGRPGGQRLLRLGHGRLLRG